MKRKLILTSIFLILGWSMMAQQVCPDKINNTTDPANPLDYRGNEPNHKFTYKFESRWLW